MNTAINAPKISQAIDEISISTPESAEKDLKLSTGSEAGQDDVKEASPTENGATKKQAADLLETVKEQGVESGLQKLASGKISQKEEGVGKKPEASEIEKRVNVLEDYIEGLTAAGKNGQSLHEVLSQMSGNGEYSFEVRLPAEQFITLLEVYIKEQDEEKKQKIKPSLVQALILLILAATALASGTARIVTEEMKK